MKKIFIFSFFLFFLIGFKTSLASIVIYTQTNDTGSQTSCNFSDNRFPSTFGILAGSGCPNTGGGVNGFGSFSAIATTNIDSVEIKYFRDGSDGSDVIIHAELFDDGAGYPTYGGTMLASTGNLTLGAGVCNSGSGGSHCDVTLNFTTHPLLTVGNVYHIVLVQNSGGGGSTIFFDQNPSARSAFMTILGSTAIASAKISFLGSTGFSTSTPNNSDFPFWSVSYDQGGVGHIVNCNFFTSTSTCSNAFGSIEIRHGLSSSSLNIIDSDSALFASSTAIIAHGNNDISTSTWFAQATLFDVTPDGFHRGNVLATSSIISYTTNFTVGSGSNASGSIPVAPTVGVSCVPSTSIFNVGGDISFAICQGILFAFEYK